MLPPKLRGFQLVDSFRRRPSPTVWESLVAKKTSSKSKSKVSRKKTAAKTAKTTATSRKTKQKSTAAKKKTTAAKKKTAAKSKTKSKATTKAKTGKKKAKKTPAKRTTARKKAASTKSRAAQSPTPKKAWKIAATASSNETPKKASGVGKKVRSKNTAAGRNSTAGSKLKSSRPGKALGDAVVERPIPKTRLSEKQLQNFKELLLAKRRELTGDVRNLTSDALGRSRSDSTGDLSSVPIHMADLGSDNWEQDFTIGLIANEQQLVREIDEALERIADRTYGVCMATHKPIGIPRLRAKPWAKYCIEYARAREMGRA